MLIKYPSAIPASEVTPYAVYRQRRQFMQAGVAAGAGLLLPQLGVAAAPTNLAALKGAPSAYSIIEKPNPFEDASGYNNYYEFGTVKEDPAHHAHTLKTRPWTVRVEGEVGKPRTFDIDDLLKLAPMEERIYRLRCVEGWSMVIPWVGYPLVQLIKQVQPTGNAKYIEFTSLADRAQMPGLRYPVLDWPYTEGLRVDEANHPLTLLTFGMYGSVLPNQNGAPVRVIVPWKYGFKSAKSIVRIRLVEKQPRTSWNAAAPSEYGFYSNVNPEVDHPRWSQASERRIGESVFKPKRKTLMFNGYGDQVAGLYAGMDLKKFF